MELVHCLSVRQSARRGRLFEDTVRKIFATFSREDPKHKPLRLIFRRNYRLDEAVRLCMGGTFTQGKMHDACCAPRNSYHTRSHVLRGRVATWSFVLPQLSGTENVVKQILKFRTWISEKSDKFRGLAVPHGWDCLG